eukprot:4781880-Amphidinium_carterae.2
MAFTQQKARNGDVEAQQVYEQLTDAPDVLKLITAANQEEPVGGVSHAQPTIGEVTMPENRGEQPKPEQQPGEPDADEAMAEDRKRIRT